MPLADRMLTAFVNSPLAQPRGVILNLLEKVDALTEGVGQVWRAIQIGNFHPNPSPQHCTTCPFRSRCPAFAGRPR